MFDIDEHPNVPKAKDKAFGNEISLAISNPCFELWGVLHYEKHDAPDDRHEVQRKLGRLMPGYDHERAPEFNFEAIKGDYADAKRNAEWISDRREAEGSPGANPSCDVFKLLDEIIKNGKGIRGGS